MDDESGDRKETAKQEAAQTAQTAKEQASDVAETAKHEAAQTYGEAKRQVMSLFRQSSDELNQQAGSQLGRLAGGLRTFSADARTMTEAVEQDNTASMVMRWAGETADDAGQWLEGRDATAVLDEVKRYARRHPGMFMLAAAGLGLVVGRLARGLKDAGQDDDATPPGLDARGESYPGAPSSAPAVPSSSATSGTTVPATVPPTTVPPSGAPPRTPTGPPTGGADPAPPAPAAPPAPSTPPPAAPPAPGGTGTTRPPSYPPPLRGTTRGPATGGPDDRTAER